MKDNAHTGNVMPATKPRDYSYEDEYVSRPVAVLTARPNKRNRGVKPLEPDDAAEQEQYDSYRLEIQQHTGSSIEITLKKYRSCKATIRDRDTEGRAVLSDCYQVTLSFAELANRIFSEKCFHFIEEEHFPQSVKDAMKGVYSDRSSG